jgi:hypothetical protein
VNYLDLDWEVVVHHSYREVNFCANVLANHGCLMEHESVFFTAYPSKFSHLLLADVMGIATPRLVSLFVISFSSLGPLHYKK